MKKKVLFHNLFRLLLSVGILLGYLFLFLFPGLVDINRCRREIKDIQMRMRDLSQARLMMIFPDQREREEWKQIRRKFRKSVPRLENSEKSTSHLKQVFAFVRDSAEDRGIKRLVVKNCGSIPVVFSTDPGLHDTEKQMISRLSNLVKKEANMPSTGPGDTGMYGPLLTGMESEAIILGFYGEIEQATSLLYHLSLSNLSLHPENIRVSANGDAPFFMVVLRFFFRSNSWRIISAPPDSEEQTSVARARGFSEKGDDSIDFNSPMLLVPVSHYRMFAEQKRKLPEYSGKRIFIPDRR